MVDGLELAATLVMDSDDELECNAEELSREVHKSFDFQGYRFDTIIVALSILLNAMVEVVDEKYKEEMDDADYRN